MFQTKVVEKIKTHIMYLKTIFFFESLVFCEVMWKNTVQPGRHADDDMTRRIHIACFIPNAIETFSDRKIFVAFPREIQ